MASSVYPGSASENLIILTPKNCFQALGNMIRVVDPGSGSWIFTYPGSRGQNGIGSRIRIRNTDAGQLVRKQSYKRVENSKSYVLQDKVYY
jgi:hypothetical protein